MKSRRFDISWIAANAPAEAVGVGTTFVVGAMVAPSHDRLAGMVPSTIMSLTEVGGATTPAVEPPLVTQMFLRAAVARQLPSVRWRAKVRMNRRISPASNRELSNSRPISAIVIRHVGCRRRGRGPYASICPAPGAALPGAVLEAVPPAHVLVVDDDTAIRVLIRHILTRCGYQVSEAVDGLEALEICAHPELQIDLVVTDAKMPRLGGTDLAAARQGSRPTTRVLLMSGYDPEALGSKDALRLPFLHKPFDVRGLIGAVHAAVTGS